MKKIFVTFPVSPSHPVLHKQVVMASWKLMHDKRYELKMIIPAHNPFENNLHHCINDFKDNDCDYWLSIDSDNPPMNNPLDLVELDRDIIGLPTPVLYIDKKTQGKGERPYYWNAYKKAIGGYNEWPDKIGLQKVDAIGTGCFLISKRVFLHPEMLKGAFTRKLNPDGTVNTGNDLSFCERATDLGFEIYSHFDYPCRHYNSVDLIEVSEAFHAMYEG